MSYDITAECLVLEITRRCNMVCDHCMRGVAQNMDINLEVIDKLFESGISFRNVTFTGGEPALFPKAILYFAEKLEEYTRTIDSFYVKTNGKHESLDMCTALVKLYSLCENDDGCTLDVSRDQFHEGYNEPHLYQALSFYHSGSGFASEEEIGFLQVIDEGYAAEYQIGRQPARSSLFSFVDGFGEEGEITLDTLQVAANGNICGQCDISFEREDKETYGNILTQDINEIITVAYDKVINEVA